MYLIQVIGLIVDEEKDIKDVDVSKYVGAQEKK